MHKYNQKKRKNQALIGKIEKHVSEQRLDDIKNCCNLLEFIADAEEKKRKMIKGITCKNRFCPLCSWRKAKKDAMVMSTMMRYISCEHEKTFIFLTLTIPNVTGAELKSAIRNMNIALKKLFKRKEVMRVSHGYMRKLEITYNSKRRDFHPHIHAVLAVNKSYGKKVGFYLTQPAWLQLWRDCTGDQSITQVDVRKMDMTKGVNEIAKYTAKDSDYLHSDEVFDIFYGALHGAQVLTYNGIFKQAKMLYDDDKLEAYKQVDETEYTYKILSSWFHISEPDDNGEVKVDTYQDIDTRLLTDDEKAEYNFKSMGESEDFKDE